MKNEESQKIKCGVAGVGYLGQHHARIYNSLDTCDLVGVFDPNEENRLKVSNEQVCEVFNNLEAVSYTHLTLPTILLV